MSQSNPTKIGIEATFSILMVGVLAATLALADTKSLAKQTPVGGILGQPAGGPEAAGLLDDDFVVAQHKGKAIKNSDLGEELSMIRSSIKNTLIEKQMEALERYLQKQGVSPKSGDVKYFISYPRYNIAVKNDDPQRGPKNARVTIVEFSDYKCGYCAKVNPVLSQVVSEYPDDVRHVFKDFAFLSQESPMIANAAQCVREQSNDKFWVFQKMAFANRKNQDPYTLKKYAQQLGLNMGQFTACQAGNKYQNKIQESLYIGQSVGVRGTPAVFINGRAIRGALGFSGFQQIIDQELAAN